MYTGKCGLFGRFAFVALVAQVYGQDFGYEGTAGPLFWGERYHSCVGKHQSPINIDDHNVVRVKMLPIIYENFDKPAEKLTLSNNGHTVMATIQTTHLPTISGGPLSGNYEFWQFHFHWGSDDSEGSETRINNNSYPMELHAVFYQKAYDSPTEAVLHPDGLVVLSFLFENSTMENPNFDPIIEKLPSVEQVNTTVELNRIPSWDDLFKLNRSVYYTYGGSLTTPPCSEVVTWIDYKDVIHLSHDQMEVFRKLKNENGDLMLHNFRPVQPLYGRIIRFVTEDDVRHEHLHNIVTSNTPTRVYELVSLLLTLHMMAR